ncbi:hypothetical protein A3A03_00320 [Candidatus Nomurabacteria bacterium RIFCSPLOWO2_01_FULL_40_18]|uniref:Uncharacterized protein n=1 Tax=Candidatus Nomurabacteria bacterium RIFCSPLOWO2_01_FULL_40_18 TaxID=1801773 RepID=A0A1F6XJL5_9BACT|nr:MAG: hypothetical protein A3A03_00320 [Candidatus Nomurabacteria bacterium RIFCSPLOWO2_01_FULL_40_18]
MKKEVKTKKMTIDKLAIMVANGFESIESRMATKDDIKDLKKDILNLGDRFVSYHSFDALAGRVKVLEDKKK